MEEITEVSVKFLAKLVGKSERRIRQINDALPDNEKLLEAGEDGKYDLPFFVQRWVDYQRKDAKGDQDSYEDIKAQHEKVKMEESKIRLGILKKEICNTEEMLRVWSGILKSLSSSLLNIPHTLAPRIANMESASEIEAMIDQEIREAMRNLAGSPMPEEMTDNGYENGMASGNVHAGTTAQNAGE